MTVWGRPAEGPGGARPRESRPSRGGGTPLARWGGYGADVPLAGLLYSAAWGGGGGGRGGRGRAGAPARPPLVHFPGSCGEWLEGPGPGPPYCWQGGVAPPPHYVLGRGGLVSLGAERGPGS